jgi:hypothetical protein
MTAGDGSAFLPYGQGGAAYLASKGTNIAVKKRAGANENLSAAVLSAVDPKSKIYRTGRRHNPTYNRIIPHHPGATRFPCRSRHQATISVKLEVATPHFFYIQIIA